MEINIMEVCGTHTMAIAKAGIKDILPKGINLISGPGCPVCVTPSSYIDTIIELSKDCIITCYGDMVRIPGTKRGTSLRNNGKNVKIVYSPVDAIKIAKDNPDKDVVFLGVGFETTAPGTAAAVADAKEYNLSNFSVLSMLKTCENALRTLIEDKDFNVSGFLCPGHVATIIGEEGFSFLAKEYNLPCVISGFEGEDILKSIEILVSQIKTKKPELVNQYTRAVNKEGNIIAKAFMDKYLEPSDEIWRGLGLIKNSGLRIKDEYSKWDAIKKFSLTFKEDKEITGCLCGDVICGKVDPVNCPMFGKICTPEDPIGPCMVSSEGACAATYKYKV